MSFVVTQFNHGTGWVRTLVCVCVCIAAGICDVYVYMYSDIYGLWALREKHCSNVCLHVFGNAHVSFSFSLDFPRGTDELDEEDAEEPVLTSIIYEGAPRVRKVHGLVRVTGGDPCGSESNP